MASGFKNPCLYTTDDETCYHLDSSERPPVKITSSDNDFALILSSLTANITIRTFNPVSPLDIFPSDFMSFPHFLQK